MILKVVAVAAVLLVVLLIAVMTLLKVTVRTRDMVRKSEVRVYGSGKQTALVLYQPSNHGSNVPLTLKLSQSIAEMGYTVTVNYPSQQLPYNLQDYDVLLFGTNVYLGETALPLKNYLSNQSFTGKTVVIFVTGRLAEQTEVEALKKLVPVGNKVHTIKVRSTEQEKLIGFVRTVLDT